MGNATLTPGLTTVIHIGPDVYTVGGTQSVIRSIRDNTIGADHVRVLTTWSGPQQVRNLGRTARAGLSILKEPRSTVMHFHISAGGAWLREGPLMALAKARGYRVVATIHGHDFAEFTQQRAKLARSVLSRADHVIVLSEADGATLLALLPGTPMSIVPNPIAIDHDAPPASEVPPIALFASAIGLRKGVDTIVDAWKLLLDEGIEGECWIVGPPEDYDVPELPQLSVKPPLHPDRVRELLRQVRVVLLPSRAEAMPMILTEALASARPFVSTAVGGIPDIAPDPAMLIPVGDERALADAIGQYLRDPKLAEAHGALGQSHIASTRSPEVIGARLRSIYEGLES